ncbi:MAG: hypothetical protein KKB50_10670 [Planctomycetes bacterium]|nr:hypothetical protein [Planctomycetota bacterium]
MSSPRPVEDEPLGCDDFGQNLLLGQHVPEATVNGGQKPRPDTRAMLDQGLDVSLEDECQVIVVGPVGLGTAQPEVFLR